MYNEDQAVDNPEMLEELMKAGMNVARSNFSHGNYEDQKDRIETIKKVRAKLGKPVALLLDTEKETCNKNRKICRP